MPAAAADTRCRCQIGPSAEAAAILLAMAMRESEAPAVELGSALARLDRDLRPCADAAGGAVLTRELAVCVRALQFHDRLMQQLAAIRNLLAHLADLPQTAGGGARRWEELLATLRERLASGSPEGLVELLMGSGCARAGGAAAVQSEGSSELF